MRVQIIVKAEFEIEEGKRVPYERVLLSIKDHLDSGDYDEEVIRKP